MSDAAKGEAAPEVVPEAPQNGSAVASNGETAKADSSEKPPGQPSGKTMFVMNIPSNMLFSYEEQIREIFSKHGGITTIKRAGIEVDSNSATDVTLAAYLHFSSAESAEKAMVEQGTVMGGNSLQLCLLKTGVNTVVVESLPVTIRMECIRSLLQACGVIKNVVKIPGRRTAFVEFEDEEGAKKAMTLSGKLMINNVKLTIDKRDANSKSAAGQKGKGQGAKGEFRRPVKRAGNATWPRGGFSNPGPQSYRGGFRGRGNYRGGANNYGGGSYWGNNEYDDDSNFMNKRRKPNDWIRQY